MPGLVKPIRVGDRAISRRRLARLVGVSPSYIGLVWSGKRNPSVALVVAIAKEFEVSVDMIIQEMHAYGLDKRQ